MEQNCLGITFQTDLWFLNELHNILQNSLWFCSDIIDIVSGFPTPIDQNVKKYYVHMKMCNFLCIYTRFKPMTFKTEISHSTHQAIAAHYYQNPPLSSTYLQQPKTFSALYCWSIRASRMLNQHSLCSDTEKWYLCNNANKFVPINKHCFP